MVGVAKRSAATLRTRCTTCPRLRLGVLPTCGVAPEFCHNDFAHASEYEEGS